MTTPENVIIYHNDLCLSPPSSVSLGGLFNSQEYLKTVLFMQNFGVTNKDHYGMLWHFLEWSITYASFGTVLNITNAKFKDFI